MATLKAFVSSTFIDLKAHRARAIAHLRGGELHVDPMEEWGAASDEPKRFCLERMKDCTLCILLLAFRKGFIPEGETLSITQMEYQYAIEHGIDVLPFLLDDGETSWPKEFDERDTDPEIGRWRVLLRKKHGCRVFRADPASLDIGPDVLRWIQGHQKKVGRVSAPVQGRVRHPFTSLQNAKLFGRSGDVEAFAPSREEYATGRVHRPALADKIEDRLKQEGWALVRGHGAAGKSVLAALIALGPSFRDKRAYYLDLSSVGERLDTSSVLESATSLDTQDTQFIIDNVHLEEDFAAAFFDHWQSCCTGSTLLMLGRFVAAPPNVCGLGSPLEHLTDQSLILQVEQDDLVGVLHRLLHRIDPGDLANVRPSSDVLAQWHRWFGGDLIAFSAAVSRCIHSLRAGSWQQLGPDDAKEYVHRKYLLPHTPEERATLLVVATLATLELDTPTEAIDPSQLAPFIRHGIVYRVPGAARRHTCFHLVHSGLGNLLLAAESNAVAPLDTFLEVLQRKPSAARLIAQRLARQQREDEATAVWRSLAEAPERLVEGLTEFGLPSSHVLWQLSTSRRILPKRHLDKILSEASDTLVRVLPQTTLGHLTSFLGYTEWNLPEARAIVVAALGRPENIECLVQASLRTDLRGLRHFLEYAEKKLPAVYADVAARANQKENIELLIERALRKPLGKHQTLLAYLGPFLEFTEQKLPDVYAAFSATLSGPENVQTLAAAAVTGSATLKLSAVDQIVVAALGRPENLEFMVQTALHSPVSYLGRFLDYAKLKLPAIYSSLLAVLNAPERIQTLAQAVVTSPPGSLLSLLDRVNCGASLAAAIDIDEWTRSQLSSVPRQPYVIPALGRKLRELGRPELAEAPARAVIRKSKVRHKIGGLVWLSHTLRLGHEEGATVIVQFLERAIGKQWLDKQYETCPVGALAAALLGLWYSQQSEVLSWFQSMKLETRLQKEFKDVHRFDANALFEKVRLLGSCGLFGVETTRIVLPELADEWERDLWEVATRGNELVQLNHTQVQLWLGLRELARLFDECLEISPAIGEQILELWKKAEPTRDRGMWLNGNMIEWLERCSSLGWALLPDDMSMGKRFALSGNGL